MTLRNRNYNSNNYSLKTSINLILNLAYKRYKIKINLF